MIGKKAAIGIIAATGVVAVGVPVGIVVGQHAAKTGTLDSKMQSKWSDIERELASSFGGFDVRSRAFSETKEQMDKYFKDMNENKVLIDKIIGVNPKDAFFNSITSIKQKMDDSVQKIKETYQTIFTKYANKLLQVENGVLKKVPYNASQYAIDADVTLNGATGVLNKIKIVANDASSTQKAAFDFNFLAKVKIGASANSVEVEIDDQSFHEFIYGNADRSALGKFTTLANQISKQSNVLISSEFINLMKPLLVLAAPDATTPTLRSYITGELTTGTAAKSFKNSFGLEEVTTAGGDFDQTIATDMQQIDKDVEEMTKNLAYLNYSLFGHHDEKLVNAAINNMIASGGSMFPSSPSGQASDVNVKDIDKIFNAKGFVPGNDAFVDETFIGEAATGNPDNIPGSMYDASRKLINDFNSNPASIAGNLYTFTNEDRFKWFKESGLVYVDARRAPGEVLQDVVANYRENKNEYQTRKEWFDNNEFSLVWNASQFESIMNKYNISSSDATFEINIEKEDGNTYKLSILPNGQIYVKDSTDKSVISQSQLFGRKVTEKPKTAYPLASDQWYGDDYSIAYSTKAGATNPDDFYEFEDNAPFVLDGKSKISFSLSVTNNDAGLTYKNTTGRKADVFSMNQNGELFVITDGDRN